jgi:hypothetical protein
MGAKSTLSACLVVWTMAVSAPSIDSVLVEEFSIGSFQRAVRVVLDAEGRLYVLDADQNKLFLFPDISTAPLTLGGFGWSAGSFDRPTGLAADGVNIFVADHGNHRIQRFDRNLNYISSLYTRDTTDAASRFGYPLDICLSQLGDLFILDGENLRVLKFNPSSFLEGIIGDINAGKGKLQTPNKLMVTASRIFISEKNRIVVYDYFGNYLGSLGEGVVSELNGFTLLEEGFLAASDSTLWFFSRDGALQTSLSLSRLISGERIDKIQDVTYNGNRLFILSPAKLHIFRIGP